MKMAYLLGAAIAVAGAFGYAAHGRQPSVAAANDVVSRNPVEPSGGVGADGAAISGRVLESIDVAKYTYLRLETGQGEIWAAVPRAEVLRGASVTVDHATRMEHFASATLKRAFDVIYFGSLAGAASAGKGLPPGHPPMGATAEPPTNGHLEMGRDPGVPEALLDDPTGPLPPGHPSIDEKPGEMLADGEEALPAGHPDTPAKAAPLVVPKLERAPGPNGLVIADVFASGQRLAGKRVRVRGMVTKVTPDVLGRTFLHVQDGSGNGDAKTNDLAITTSARPAVGDVLIFDGALRLDADLGIGYRYPALLENATASED